MEAVAVLGFFGFVVGGCCLWGQHKRIAALEARLNASDRQRKERAGRMKSVPRLVHKK